MTNQLIKLKSSIFNSSRNKKLLYGVSSGIIAKAISFLITLTTIPMALEYLGQERYGIWVTIISILAWVSLIDIGIANGLVPILTDAISKKRPDLGKRYITTAFWNLSIISFILLLVLYVTWSHLDLSAIFNTNSESTKTEIKHSIAIAIAIFSINLPLSITQKIYLSNQDGASLNKWQIISSLSSLIGIYLATKTEGGLKFLVIGYSGSQLIITIINTAWLYFFYKPEFRPSIRPNFIDTKKVMSIGGLFFINQIATLLIFQKDNILITNLISPLQAGQFSISWQMFFYVNTLNLLIAPYLGPAFCEAYAKKDLKWMKSSAKRYLILSISFTTILSITLAIFHNEILKTWVGPHIKTTQTTIYWMALWSITLGIQWPIISLLNSIGRLKKFTLFYLLSAIVNLFLSIFLIEKIGIHGGLIASVTSIIAISLIPSIRELLITIKQTEFNSLR